jgi:hypothetical protein
MSEGAVGFFLILFGLCLLAWESKNESDKFKAKGCYETVNTIVVDTRAGWQCPDGCFYYKNRGEFICFKD